MAKPDAVFIYIGTYPSEAATRNDYEMVKDLHAAGAVGTYDAAVVTKDDAGKIHVNKDETATRHGAWGGAAVGAVVGILFPPAIIGSALVGAAVGGVGGTCGQPGVGAIGVVRRDGQVAADLVDGDDEVPVRVQGVLRADVDVPPDLVRARVQNGLSIMPGRFPCRCCR